MPHKDPAKHRACNLAWGRRYRASAKGRAVGMHQSAVERARKKKERPPSRALIPRIVELLSQPCPLCGYPHVLHIRDMRLSPTLDRVQHFKPYTRKNTQVVHYDCNRIKGRFDEALVKPHIKAIMKGAYGHLFKAIASRARAEARRR